jgi:hypothetical protein
MNTLMAPFLLSGFTPSVLQWFPIVRRKDEEKYGEAWGEPFGFAHRHEYSRWQGRLCRTLSDEADGVGGVWEVGITDALRT